MFDAKQMVTSARVENFTGKTPTRKRLAAVSPYSLMIRLAALRRFSPRPILPPGVAHTLQYGGILRQPRRTAPCEFSRMTSTHGMDTECLTCRHTRSDIHSSGDVERFIVQAAVNDQAPLIMLLILNSRLQYCLLDRSDGRLAEFAGEILGITVFVVDRSFAAFRASEPEKLCCFRNVLDEGWLREAE